MKILVAELAKAIEYLKKQGNEAVRIDFLSPEVVRISGADLSGNIITIKLYDTENNNSFAKITETRRL